MFTLRRRNRIARAPLLILVWAAPVHAVDGVNEINQVRAAAGGIAPGDAAGFPVTIDAPGSYRLTSNLDLRGEPTPEDAVGIRVTADDVTSPSI